jgi:uncharacterized protein (TIGR03437 family)
MINSESNRNARNICAVYPGVSRQSRYLIRAALILAALLAVTPAQSQTLTTLYSFCAQANCADGQNPSGVLLQGSDGSFYGTATGGATGYGVARDSAGYGTIFRLTPAGSLTVLHAFSGADGASPANGVIVGPDGNFYGTDEGWAPTLTVAGANISGGIFQMTPSGALTVLGSVPSGTDISGNSWSPVSGLILAPDGNFYGATQIPLSGPCSSCGTVFRITPGGTLTTLHVFNGTDGLGGYSTLTLGPDGNFYGTVQSGGNAGTIYKITASGSFTLLYAFSGPDGQGPVGGLTLGPDGNFYGMTEYGGTLPYGGTIFRITPAGALTTLHDFNGSELLPAIQPEPNSALVLGPDGNFYGTTEYGGTCSLSFVGCGTIFRISPAGDFATVYSFSGSDGRQPITGLTLGSDGNLYGTTGYGGTKDSGTLFRFSLPHTPPSIAANGIVNGATFAAPVAPGSIASLFGTFAIPNLISSSTFPAPTILSGLSIQFGSAPLAPLFFASQSQVNLQIPWELAGQAQTTVAVSQYGQSSATQTLPLAAYSPGIFVMNGQTNQAAALDLSYNLVGPANPTTAGAYVQIYCTGLGPVTNQPATGAPALSGPLSWTAATPIVTIGGVASKVVFSGLAPGEVGLYQVDAQVPGGIATGPSVPVTISVSGAISNTATLVIH